MKRIDLIVSALENLNSMDLMEVWNEYCSATHDDENIIYNMCDFDDQFPYMFHGMSALEVIAKVRDDLYDFDTEKEFFKGCDEYSLESVWSVEDVVDYDDLSEYIDRYDEDFGNDDIAKALRGNRDKYVEVLNGLSMADLISVYNDYAMRVSETVMIFAMPDFNDRNNVFKPLELAYRIHNGKFNPYDNYWWYDGNANLVSTSVKSELPIDTDAIADYMDENETDFDNPVLMQALSNTIAE